MSIENDSPVDSSQFYLVGGGIASLTAAALLIRDGKISGERIQVFEQSDILGGSLDGSGSPEDGYVIRGGRMFEKHFVCTYDLFDSIPTLTDPTQSVSEEIHDFNRKVVTSSKSRLVQDGRKVEAPHFGLNYHDKCDLIRLSLKSEDSMGALRIDEYFSSEFFRSNFWLMWSTMFSFQSWHSLVEFQRYMRRFAHLLPGFNRLEGILRTVFNQYDSLILPLSRWLEDHGVCFQMETQVVGLDFEQADGSSAVRRIRCVTTTGQSEIDVAQEDLVFVTLGSMTEGSSLGTMEMAPIRQEDTTGAWALWNEIAEESTRFGQPSVFCTNVEKTNWVSFTVTLQNHGFFDFMKKFTENASGTGGIVTFQNSNWCMSVVLAHQPHFINQPNDIDVFWGYGLFSEKEGNIVKKKMSECSGAEILEELAFHLPLEQHAEEFFLNANCLPCMMPFITSQFMPRRSGDRPNVVPDGATNFAFLGQYCELPEETVFTVEYSIRTAQRAVYSLLNLDQKETPMYRGYNDPIIMSSALWTLLNNG